MKRKCSKCGREKPLTSEFFYKDTTKTGGYTYVCKECYIKKNHNYGQKNQQILDDIKKKCSCALCGYNKYPEALDFHHINPEDKKYRIHARTICRKDVVEEMNKCMVLCKNCHAHITRIERKDIAKV